MLAPRLQSTPGVKPFSVVRDPTALRRTGAPGIGMDVQIIGCLNRALSLPIRVIGI